MAMHGVSRLRISKVRKGSMSTRKLALNKVFSKIHKMMKAGGVK